MLDLGGSGGAAAGGLVDRPPWGGLDEREGEPPKVGEPRRGAPAVRPLGRFGSRCRLSFPLIWPANYRQIFIGKLKGLTVPV